MVSDASCDNGLICTECKAAGVASFFCALCNKKQPSSKEQKTFGDPPEKLCRDCYESVPANIWEAKCVSLYNEHRYDFE